MYILLLFVVKNRDLYTTSQEIHSFNTSYNTNLHFSMANYTTFLKMVFYFFGIKLFNLLPINIKNLPNEIKLFKHALTRFIFYIHFIQQNSIFTTTIHRILVVL